jgi:diguanylate cyclase
MRYLQSRENSSELLRLALPLMGRQTAGFHPVSYSLWYEHVAGINPRLSQQLATRLEGAVPLTDEDVYRLYSHYIADRDLEDHERWQQQLRSVMDAVTQDTAEVGRHTGEFGTSLRDRRVELGTADNLDSARGVIERLARETERMQAVAQDLASRFEERVREVERLSHDLERAQSEALLDPLSGLKNRRGLERAVHALFASGEAEEVAILLVDVDRFKTLNDTYGHLLGDKVLRAVAHILQTNIKGRDVAARLGGDELAILLPGTTERGAEALAEQIRAGVAGGRIHRADGQDLKGIVTVSIGIAAGKATESFEALVERADAALYRAKREGRNRVCVAPRAP